MYRAYVLVDVAIREDYGVLLEEVLQEEAK